MKKMSKITLVILLSTLFFSPSGYAMKVADVSSNLSPKNNEDELGKIVKRAYQCECLKKVLASFTEENEEVNDAMETGSAEYLNELVRAYKQESKNSYDEDDIPGSLYYDYFALKLMRQVMLKFPDYFPKDFITSQKIINLENKIQKKLDLLGSFRKDCQAD